MSETPVPNEPHPEVYWDVNVVGYSPDDRAEQVLVERFEYVSVHMDSDAVRISVRDFNNEEMAVFFETEDEEAHATIGPQGVKIANLATEQDRSVFLELRPHPDGDADIDRGVRFP